MILLDTNVLSEALKPRPSDRVLGWLAAQEPAIVFTTAITLAEVLYGVECLPHGKRRTSLESAIEKMFAEALSDRILPFDDDAARHFARIVRSRDAAGRPISQSDGMIAAIARCRRASLATRNTGDFDRCGIHIINPWSD